MSELLRGLSQLSSSGWKKHYLPGKICIHKFTIKDTTLNWPR